VEKRKIAIRRKKRIIGGISSHWFREKGRLLFCVGRAILVFGGKK
jgi:hypothetical protein